MARSRLTLAALVHLMRRSFGGSADRRAVRNGAVGPVPSSMQFRPYPRSMGLSEQGEDVAQGKLTLGGRPLVAPGPHPWDLSVPDRVMLEQLHGFVWLDDLAAIGNGAARRQAQAWTLAWIRRHSNGSGPGWTPQLAGRRATRWVFHGRLLTRALPPEDRQAVLECLSRHCGYIEARIDSDVAGLPRIEAATGLVHGALALGNRDKMLSETILTLGREAEESIDEAGAVTDRSPETLLQITTQLVWAARALEEAGRPVDPRHLAAIERAVPVLRALRLPSGLLPRYNDGGDGGAGKLDLMLADANVRAGRDQPALKTAMGFGRLRGGKAMLVIDAGRPQRSAHTARTHAGTLGIEFHAGNQPLIINCGPGSRMSRDWARAARSTAFHSTMVLDRQSSSKFWKPGLVTRAFGELVEDGPKGVTFTSARDITGSWLNASHDGYLDTLGLLHERKVFLGADGLSLFGEDSVSQPDTTAKQTFAKRLKGLRGLGLMSVVHFHIHPEVDVRQMREDKLFRLYLPTGETWVLRHSTAEATLETSSIFLPGLSTPKPSRQIQLRGQIKTGSETLGWSLQQEKQAAKPARPDREMAEYMNR